MGVLVCVGQGVITAGHAAMFRGCYVQDVAKFKEVLLQNRIPPSRGIFITTSYFSPRARHVGIRCYDGKELKALESAAAWAPLTRALRSGLLLAITGCSVYYYIMFGVPGSVEEAAGNAEKELRRGVAWLRAQLS